MAQETTEILESEVKQPKLRRPRRKLTAEYKLRILKEADKLSESSELAVLLRREGLYLATLYNWRRLRDVGALTLMSVKRGRKSKHTPGEIELERLRQECARLEKRLQQAELIIEVQKKVSILLENSALQPGKVL